MKKVLQKVFGLGLAFVLTFGLVLPVAATDLNWAIAPQWDEAHAFSDGLAAVRVGNSDTGLWGFINTSGAMVIEPQFNQVGRFSEGFAAVRMNHYWGFINTSGDMVVEPQFRQARHFSYGLAPVQAGNDWGFINASGQFVIEPQFTEAGNFAQGLAAVRVGGWDTGLLGFINTSGVMVIEPQFDRAGDFAEGLAPVRTFSEYWSANRWGYINATGNLVIAPDFHDAGSFSSGLARVFADSGLGYIDTVGNMVIPAQFGMASAFNDGFAVVGKDTSGLIDTTGRFVLGEFLFDDGMAVHGFADGLAVVSRWGAYGFVTVGASTAPTAPPAAIHTPATPTTPIHTPAQAIYINGHRFALDVPPKNVDGHLLVPLRAIGEAFGADLTWVPDSQTANVHFWGTTVALQINNPAALVITAGVETIHYLDVVPVIEWGRTMVPLRFIGEIFGAEVRWEAPYAVINQVR